MCFLAALVLKEIRLFYGTDTLSFSLNLLKTISGLHCLTVGANEEKSW